jgi:hypothetical protein
MTTGFGLERLISLVMRGHSRFCWQAIDNDVIRNKSISFQGLRRSTVDQYGSSLTIGSVVSEHASLARDARRTL